MSTKVIIVYESRYGNTKLVAETIAEGMREVAGVETTVSEPKNVDLSEIPGYDAILVGSPNHMGGPTGGSKKFIDKLGKLSLEGKVLAAFDTCLSTDLEKAMNEENGKADKREGTRIEIDGSGLINKGLQAKVELLW